MTVINEQAEKAKVDYMAGMKYKDIAEKYSVSINTVKSWQKRHKWTREGAPKTEKGCTQNKKAGAPKGNKNAKGHGAPVGNKNALGNNGGPPKGNANAMTHGLFAKYLPAETLEIAQGLIEISPIELLWTNICLKHAAILRAQKIMFVKNQEDLTKELKRQKESVGESSESWEKEYELQFAWDKQANFLQAQSTAMRTLTNMIKEYDELCRSELATDEQRLRVAKLKAEVENLQSDNQDDGVKIIDDIGDADE